MDRTSAWRHREDDPCESVEVPFEPTAARLARELLRSALSAWGGCGEETIADAELVVSELVANSIEHGRPTANGTLELSWCLRDDRLLVSVRDEGEGSSLGLRDPSADRESGRGLRIVDYLCDNWRVELDGGTRVTAELDVVPPASAVARGA